MLSIIYASTAEHAFDDDELTGLLTTSRDNNIRDGLTGMLLYRAGRFLQVLEGPDDRVRGRMASITGDARHHDIQILLEEMVVERRFPDWTMGFEAVTGDAVDDPGYRQSFDDLDDAEDVDGTLAVLRPLMRWFTVRHDGTAA